jgi:hypothetical protein
MTLSEFAMHRPKLYRSLSEFLASQWEDPGTDVKEWELGDADVQAAYHDGVRFIVSFESLQWIICLDDGGWTWAGDL